MKLQDKLILSRKKRGFTQNQLSKELQVTRQTISRWEHGTALPSMDNLRRLSQLYGVTLDYFIDKELEEIDSITETVDSVSQNNSDNSLTTHLEMDELMGDKYKEIPTVKKIVGRKRTVVVSIVAIMILCVVCFFIWKEFFHEDTVSISENEGWLSDLEYDDVESSQHIIFQFE